MTWYNWLIVVLPFAGVLYEEFQARLRRLHLPGSLRDLGFPVPENTLDDCTAFICASSAMKDASHEDCRRLRDALEFIICK